MVSQDRVEGNWNRIVGVLKEKYGQITGDELAQVDGNVDQLVGLLQKRTGQSKEQINAFLTRCCKSSEQSVNRLGEQAADYASVAGEAVRDNYEQVVEGAREGYQQTLKQMKKRPLESIAVAVGVGVLTGLCVGLSLTKRR